VGRYYISLAALLTTRVALATCPTACDECERGDEDARHW